MRPDQLAVQLYTLREQCRTGDDLARTLAAVRALGYGAVQVSGVPATIPAAEIRRRCDDAGLTICATHEAGAMICDTPQAVVERLGVLGCTYTAYPYPHLPLTTLSEVEALAGRLAAAGAMLRRAGQVLCYHNHHHEFARVAGRTVLDWLYDLCPAADLQGEPDTYWVQTGGGDPVAWCERLRGRLPLLHLKDYGVAWVDGKPQVRMEAVGEGNLDWARIVPAAEAAGCRWFIVEQDVCPRDPFDCLRSSRERLLRFCR